MARTSETRRPAAKIVSVNRFIWKIRQKPPEIKRSGWLLAFLAQSRGLVTPQKLKDFLNPTQAQIEKVKVTDIDRGRERVMRALKNHQKIVVYSDYDADGLCATAIMWETLYDAGASVMPYVPHRIKEGYGMTTSAISEMAKQGVKLIITVDQGVTAREQVKYAKKLGIDVVITDHHVLPKTLPKPVALVHTTEFCGAGVSWRFCWELIKKLNPSYKEKLLSKLELAALATIADLVPLIGGSRAMVKLGLERLAKTRRPGLVALVKSSGIAGSIGTYEIGHILAPRINAMGRIEHGLDSLRLLCAKNQAQADKLATILSKTNSRRQDLTTRAITSAIDMVEEEGRIGIVQDREWHEGIIGLVASRLVETYNRPIIAISLGETFSKGSARSIPGFNIVEAIRSSSQFLVDGGGHPMAAGFTIRTEHIEVFKQNITKYAQKYITDDLLEKQIDIVCALEREDITRQNFELICKFEPFGIGNPQPVFITRGMTVEDIRSVGGENQHLKLQVDGLSAIGFNMGNLRAQLRPGDAVDLVYTMAEDKYALSGQIQLKLKDLAITN